VRHAVERLHRPTATSSPSSRSASKLGGHCSALLDAMLDHDPPSPLTLSRFSARHAHVKTQVLPSGKLVQVDHLASSRT
jgi:hypothetical protein